MTLDDEMRALLDSLPRVPRCACGKYLLPGSDGWGEHTLDACGPFPLRRPRGLPRPRFMPEVGSNVVEIRFARG